tara:strand:- start:141 stop:371 length:231 start_codon:yes stop_codon:yes gene_type:complete
MEKLEIPTPPKPFWKMNIEELKDFSLVTQEYDKNVNLIDIKPKKTTKKKKHKTRKVKIRLKKKFIRKTLKRKLITL